jgi:hypothetical protein
VTALCGIIQIVPTILSADPACPATLGGMTDQQFRAILTHLRILVVGQFDCGVGQTSANNKFAILRKKAHALGHHQQRT